MLRYVMLCCAMLCYVKLCYVTLRYIILYYIRLYCVVFYIILYPLWSSGQSFWLQIQRSRVRSAAIPDFLSSSGSGTGSTQPREPREVN